jgi:hypothetical protein
MQMKMVPTHGAMGGHLPAVGSAAEGQRLIVPDRLPSHMQQQPDEGTFRA